MPPVALTGECTDTLNGQPTTIEPPQPRPETRSLSDPRLPSGTDIAARSSAPSIRLHRLRLIGAGYLQYRSFARQQNSRQECHAMHFQFFHPDVRRDIRVDSQSTARPETGWQCGHPAPCRDEECRKPEVAILQTEELFDLSHISCSRLPPAPVRPKSDECSAAGTLAGVSNARSPA